MSLTSAITDIHSETTEDEEIAKEKQVYYLREVVNVHSMDEFVNLKLIGEGSYAKVIKALHKETGETFALKVINKKHMKKVIT
jgi:serine/threonine protein kinase